MADQCLDRLEMEMGNLAAAQDSEISHSISVRDGRSPMGTTGGFLPKVVKLDFPNFNSDEDPISWVCLADQFFEYHQTSTAKQVSLEERFERYGPSCYQDFFGDLTKLRQIETLRDYQTDFFRLLLRARKLSEEHQVGCFVNGLKQNMKVDVQACKLTTLSTAIRLARLYESHNQSDKNLASALLKKASNEASSSSPISLPIRSLLLLS
ncbi:hypothetical protein AMTRI_Chr05g70230 [Amborella trichopoda]